MKHEDVWRAIDTLAAEKGLSPSGLARAAGLDPTSFNRSKRAAAHGRLRWPSTESLSRVLAATGASLENFTALVDGARALATSRPSGRVPEHGEPAARCLPQLAFSALQGGEDAAESGEETAIPIPADAGSYAIRLDTDAFEPALREGGLLIASPDAPVRSGDRVMLRRNAASTLAGGAVLAGPMLAGVLRGVLPDGIDVQAFGCGTRLALHADQISWMHRIGWASL